MKKLIGASVLAIAMTSTAAYADEDDTDTFEISATVQQECSLENPDDVSYGALSIDEDAGETALLLTTDFDNRFQDVWASCNFPTNITISTENNGLVNQDQTNNGPDATDFTDELEYRVFFQAQNIDDVFYVTAQNPSNRTKAQQPFHELAQIRTVIQGPDGDNPNRPLAGTYVDRVTIALGPL